MTGLSIGSLAAVMEGGGLGARLLPGDGSLDSWTPLSAVDGLGLLPAVVGAQRDGQVEPYTHLAIFRYVHTSLVNEKYPLFHFRQLDKRRGGATVTDACGFVHRAATGELHEFGEDVNH